jgi:hypothetical protein
MRIARIIKQLEKILGEKGNLECFAQNGMDPSDPEPVIECVVRSSSSLSYSEGLDRPIVLFEVGEDKHQVIELDRREIGERDAQ